MRLALLCTLALAACATVPPAQTQATDPRAAEAAQVYQNLVLAEFEQQMLDDDKRLTYGFAVVNCGLRDQHWLDMLQAVYAADYQAEFQRHPLTPAQAQAARAYAEAQISNPAPPPYICRRLSTDSSLADLDFSIALQSLTLSARPPSG